MEKTAWCIRFLLVLLLFFGGKKLPELAKGLGKGIKEFKDASNGIEKEENKNLAESNKLLSDFLNSSSDMIFLKDDHLRHVYANKALSDFLGK